MVKNIFIKECFALWIKGAEMNRREERESGSTFQWHHRIVLSLLSCIEKECQFYGHSLNPPSIMLHLLNIQESESKKRKWEVIALECLFAPIQIQMPNAEKSLSYWHCMT